MIIKKRNFIWLIPLVLMITFPIWRIPIGNFLTPRGGYDKEYGNIDREAHNFIMDDVIILESTDGRITSKIRSATAKTSDIPNEYLLTEVNSDIFNKDGDITNIISRKGRFNTETELLTLTENVIVHKIETNQRLYTDLLYYNDKQQTVHCPGKTKIKGDTFEVNGSSLDYDVEKGHWEIGGRVLCILQESFKP